MMLILTPVGAILCLGLSIASAKDGEPEATVAWLTAFFYAVDASLQRLLTWLRDRKGGTK